MSPQKLDIRLESVPASGSRPAMARLMVRDTGSGMSAETQRRIGEPFFTTKAPGHGTGLGLASAFHSISDSGGSWRVESETGKGTLFIVDLPLVAVVNHRQAAPLAAANGGLQGTVLVVDDEPMVRAVLSRQLTHAGMRVVIASGAEEALTLLRAGSVSDLSVILLDISMPGMSGEQALPLLHEAAPGTPVVALSGHVPEDLSLPGVAAVLQKPMGQRELVDAVRQAITEAARRRDPS
jgi:CheY-like chemotaxis protein